MRATGGMSLRDFDLYHEGQRAVVDIIDFPRNLPTPLGGENHCCHYLANSIRRTYEARWRRWFVGDAGQ